MSLRSRAIYRVPNLETFYRFKTTIANSLTGVTFRRYARTIHVESTAGDASFIRGVAAALGIHYGGEYLP